MALAAESESGMLTCGSAGIVGDSAFVFAEDSTGTESEVCFISPKVSLAPRRDGAAGDSEGIQLLIRFRASSEISTKRIPASRFDSLIHAISPLASIQSFEPGS